MRESEIQVFPATLLHGRPGRGRQDLLGISASPVTVGSVASRSLSSDTEQLPASEPPEEAEHDSATERFSQVFEEDDDFLINFVFSAFSHRSAEDIVADHCFHFE